MKTWKGTLRFYAKNQLFEFDNFSRENYLAKISKMRKMKSRKQTMPFDGKIQPSEFGKFSRQND